MRVVLSSLLAATAFFGNAPLMAVPLLDELEIELRGEAQGWLNATCTYYDIGWLSDEQSSQALRRLLVRIKGDFLGDDLARQAKKIPLERCPGCQAIWPATGK